MIRYNSIRLTLILLLTSSIPLFAQFAGGSGTARDPWKVATAEQLDNVRRHLNASFVQTADINLDLKPWNQGEGWKPIGSHSSRFTGSYNGAGFVIKGLKIKRPDGDAQGLFGCLEGSVHNLGLKNINIQGDTGVGALVGENLGSIRSCFSTGNVKGKNDVGGLVGNNYYGFIINSFSRANVEGRNNTGGLIGYDEEGEIIDCYSAGKVQGNQRTGGLIGESEGGIVFDSYWDINKSGQKHSSGGMGRRTSEMVHPYSHNTYEGWDRDIWAPDNGHKINGGYPYLAKPSSLNAANTTSTRKQNTYDSAPVLREQKLVALKDYGDIQSTLQPEKDEKPFDFVPYEDSPVPLGRISPVYPDFAKRAGVQGTVMLAVDVYKDGSVRNIRVLKSVQSGPGGLDEAAMNAIRGLRFQPGRADGNPVDTTVNIPVEFKLN